MQAATYENMTMNERLKNVIICILVNSSMITHWKVSFLEKKLEILVDGDSDVSRLFG